MKIYIISNSYDKSESFENALEKLDANITLKEVSSDEKKIANLASAALESKAPNFVLVFVKDPIAANMYLNKQRNINSAVCNSNRDFELARKNNINVIVVGDDLDDADGFAKMLMSNGMQKMSQKSKPSQSKNQDQKPTNHDKGQVRDQKQKAEEDEQSESQDDQLPKRPGIIGHLKDALGIIDN